MGDSTQQPDSAEQIEREGHRWQTEAWVYFVWIAFGSCVNCKIGYSTLSTTIRNAHRLASNSDRLSRTAVSDPPAAVPVCRTGQSC